jgi:hypothetical protein
MSVVPTPPSDTFTGCIETYDTHRVKHWYRNGQLYRQEYLGFGDFWYCDNGRLYHREDGPAVIMDDRISWWYRGQKLDCQTQQEFKQLMKMRAFW